MRATLLYGAGDVRVEVDPGRVFDTTVDLDGVPGGCRAMDERTSLEVLVRP